MPQHSKTHSLPQPSTLAAEHSARLMHQIKARIHTEGALCFADYMQMALYEPGLGYYSAGAQKFGAAGDFVTAPEISPLFSRCLARQCETVLQTTGGNILEFGAGSGQMALDILRELDQRQCLPDHYYILEPSAELRERQKQKFLSKAPEYLNRLTWLDTLPTGFSGMILANEVLDAMPVHLFKIDRGSLQEFYVTFEENQLAWQLQAPDGVEGNRLKQAVEALDITWTEPYTSEINLHLLPWIGSLSDCLKQGAILLIDYGFPRREYYHPDRHMGTLMCHYQHRAHGDPLIYPGIQDITAHVDFTAIAEAAMQHHLDIQGYTHQTAFLVNCGLADLMPASTENPVVAFEYAQQVKQLTLPGEMGELFKVIGLSRNYDAPLLGFRSMNQLARL